MSELFVYKVTKMSLNDYRLIEGKISPWEIGECVCAVLAVREKFPEIKDNYGRGDFFLAPLPLQDQKLIIWRPNQFSEGYVVSPVELPWMK